MRSAMSIARGHVGWVVASVKIGEITLRRNERVRVLDLDGTVKRETVDRKWQHFNKLAHAHGTARCRRSVCSFC